MRAHTFLRGKSLDLIETDALVADFLASGAPWLVSDSTRKARLGLHELLVNIREHAYERRRGPIDVGMTVTQVGLTITVTDWGRRLVEVDVPERPHLSDGGYGLAIIEGCFDEAAYHRGTGHNVWTLTLHRGEETTR